MKVLFGSDSQEPGMQAELFRGNEIQVRAFIRAWGAFFSQWEVRELNADGKEVR